MNILEAVVDFVKNLYNQFGFLAILIILGIAWAIRGILGYFSVWLFQEDPDEIGEIYEKQVYKTITEKMKIDCYRNILVHNGDNVTEIDMAFVTRKGIHVVECKSHNGQKLYGNVMSNEHSLNGTSIPNPIYQNEYHIRALIKKLGISANICKNVIMTNASLDIIYNNKHYSKALYVELLNAYIVNSFLYFKDFQKLYKKTADILTDEEVLKYSEIFKSMQASKEELKEFKEQKALKEYLARQN